MTTRLSLAERVAAGAALLGIIASFVSWYSYVSGSSVITVDAFRASLLGFVFAAACATALVLLAARAQFISISHVPSSLLPNATLVAFAAVAVQIILASIQGKSLSGGIGLAVLSAAALVWGTHQHAGNPHTHAVVR